MTEYQAKVRAICSHMTREKAAERIDCSVSTIDKYLAESVQEPSLRLARRIDKAYAELIPESITL